MQECSEYAANVGYEQCHLGWTKGLPNFLELYIVPMKALKCTAYFLPDFATLHIQKVWAVHHAYSDLSVQPGCR
jgi:hypothetical protein